MLPDSHRPRARTGFHRSLLGGLLGSLLVPAAVAAQPFLLGLRVDTPAPASPGGIAIGQLDSDGKLDLVVTNPTLASVSVQRGDGRGGFAPRADYPTGLGPNAVALANLNGDGKLDIVVANSTSHTVTVYLGRPLAEFGTRQDFATGMTPLAVAIGDVNLDSKPDLVVANAGANTVSILLGTGTGSFGAKTDFTTGARPEHLALADINEDGKLDVVTVNRDAWTLSVLRGQGNGAFEPKTDTATGSFPLSLALGDVNDDGHLDAFVGDQNGDIAVLLGTGLGGFSPPTFETANPGPLALAHVNDDLSIDLVVGADAARQLEVLNGQGNGAFDNTGPHVPVGGQVRSMAIADVNGDGALDVVLATEAVNKVSVFLAWRSLFGPAVNFPTGASPQLGVLADLNGDGHLDLAVPCFTADSVSIHLGNGAGGFAPRVSYATGDGPAALAIADVSGDQKPDLVVTNLNEGSLSVLLGNGAGAFGPKTNHATGLSPTDVAIGDVSGDGKPDLVVASWAGSAVSVLVGNGTGGFAPKVDVPTGFTVTNPFSVELARMNGDANLDIVASNYATDRVAILLANGSGGFSAPMETDVGSQPMGVAVGDINGDGIMDVAVANRSGVTSVSVLIGNGLGGASSIVPLSTNATPAWIDMADVNSDGRLDLAVLNQGGPSISLLYGDGGGRFAPDQEVPAPFGLNGFALGDLDENGRLDLLVMNGKDANFTRWLGRALTRTALTASPNPVAFGGMLTLTAAVTVPPQGSGPVTGLVRFRDGSTFLGSAVPINGVATLQVTASLPWFRTYQAKYSGDDRLFGSFSPLLEIMTYVTNVGATPQVLALALEGARPNPTSLGRLHVHFTLPVDVPARLELFDVRGRRMAEQEVRGAGAGFHVLSLEGDRPIPAGVYLLRLTQEGVVRLARAVVLD